MRIAVFLFSLLMTALFGFAFYDRYWRWRDCFNELGRCFDPVQGDVVLEQAGEIYGLFAALSLTLTLLSGFALFHARRKKPRL